MKVKENIKFAVVEREGILEESEITLQKEMEVDLSKIKRFKDKIRKN